MISLIITRGLSSGPKKGLINKFVDIFKSELLSDKEMRENLRKFKLEREKLEQTEAIKQAREKFKQVEEESIKEANQVYESFKSSVKKATDTQIFNNEIVKQIATKAEDIKNSAAYRTVEDQFTSSLYNPVELKKEVREPFWQQGT